LSALTPPVLPDAPQLQAPVMAGREITLTWTAQPGSIYRVRTTASLSAPFWEDVEGDVIAGDSTATKTVTATDSQRFYRVLALLP